MCIIAIDKRNKCINEDTFKNMFYNNPDGFGGMFAANGKINTYKTYNEDTAWQWYEENKRKNPTSIFILHFRISTGGDGIDNLHPFRVNNNLYFVHNGHFSGFGDALKNQSDTNEIRNLLKLFPANFLDIGIVNKLLNNLCGHYSKLVFLSSNGNIKIFNEELFVTDKNGFLYSNNSYMNYIYGDKYDDDDDEELFVSTHCDFCTEYNCDNCPALKNFYLKSYEKNDTETMF